MHNYDQPYSMKLLNTIIKYMGRRTPEVYYDLRLAKDPRHQSFITYPIEDILMPLLRGLLQNMKKLRDVERVEKGCSVNHGKQRKAVPSDTTMLVTPARMVPGSLRPVLVSLIKRMVRNHALNPMYGPKKHVITIDGKKNGYCKHDAGGYGQPKTATDPETGETIKLGYLSRVVRAVLTSAPSSPVVAQMPIPADSNDMGMTIPMVKQLIEDYGGTDMLGVLDFDAGFCSEEAARFIDEKGLSYIFSSKDNQPTLLEEADRQLGLELHHAPEACSGWEIRNGDRMMRELWRSSDIQGYHGWDHARQVWLVRQTTQKLVKDKKGREVWQTTEVFDRRYITNLRQNTLSLK